MYHLTISYTIDKQKLNKLSSKPSEHKKNKPFHTTQHHAVLIKLLISLAWKQFSSRPLEQASQISSPTLSDVVHGCKCCLKFHPPHYLMWCMASRPVIKLAMVNIHNIVNSFIFPFKQTRQLQIKQSYIFHNNKWNF